MYLYNPILIFLEKISFFLYYNGIEEDELVKKIRLNTIDLGTFRKVQGSH